MTNVYAKETEGRMPMFCGFRSIRNLCQLKVLCIFLLTLAVSLVFAGRANAQLVPSASFLGADTTTQGNWIGTYGADGYDIVNGPQSPANAALSYGSYSLANELEWTYAGSTTDKRALETDAQGDRTAAVWYSAGTFSFDVNLTDTNTHKVALYLLDWDQQGRNETVSIVNASNPGLVLDTRSIPNANTSSLAYTNTTGVNFSGGTYLVWNISGHVTITVSNSGYPNAVVEGIFFGAAGNQTQAAPTITSANVASFTVGQSGTFTVTATGSPTPALAAGGATLPTGVSFVDNHNGTGTLSGSPSTNAGSPYQISFTASNGVSPAGTQSFTLTVNSQVVVTGPSAAFLTANTSTQGNWMATYGADGYDVVNGPQSPANGTLSYGSYAVQGESEWTYAGSTSDQRALETDAQGDRTAATWYSGAFSIDVNFTDTTTHQVALYLLDWDHQGRAETITITNYSSGAVLDARQVPNANSSSSTYTNTTATNFGNGTYLAWNVSGHVTITVTASGGPNAVVEGIFFGAAGSQTQTAPSITSANVASFTVGQSGTFTVTATGSPTPALAAGGATLPTGVSFVDNHNGTGTLSGSPSTNAGSPYQISFTASNGVSPAGTQSFTLTVNPQVVVTGPSAAFLTANTSTQGNWMATYGADGYDVVNGPQSPANGTLSYGSYAVQGESEWTYAGSTSDQRALETDAQGDRTAATWYSGALSLDVNFTDTNTHQVALYLLDWDHQGRAETITITNYSSGAVLDSRSIPNANSSSSTYTNTTATNFGNGTYLAWNVSGHVTITVTASGGPNAVVEGIFFGAAGSQTQTAPSITSANVASFTVGQAGTFTVVATGSPTPTLAAGGATLPTGVSFVDNRNGTGTLSGSPSTNAGSPYQISFTATNGVSPAGTQSFTLTVNPQVVVTGPSAAFVSADIATQGSWIGAYGANGYDVAGGPQSPANGTLSYGTYALQSESEWTYSSSTSDQRALKTDAQGDRTAAAWYSGTFSIDVNFTDTNTHQVALYLLDWDHQGRAETITITNFSSGAVLDSRNIPNANSSSSTYTNTTATNFGNGTYLAWNVSGHVTVTVTANGGPNAVVSGIFFGAATQMAPAITSANSATFPVGQPGNFTVTTAGFPLSSLSESGPLPSGVNFVDNGNGTGTLSGTPAAGSSSSYSISFTATNGVSPTFTQSFILTVHAVVNFVALDTTTQGNWMGTYGTDGYDMAYAAQSLPSYDQAFSVVNPDVGGLWGNSGTTDPRALEVPGSSRIPTEWNSLHFSLPPTFGFDVNFTDGQSHLLALYALDWDYQGRAEMIQLFDANSNALLDTEYISNFASGVYAIWTVSGHVMIDVTETVGTNSVISGVFFGGSASSAINIGITPPNVGLPPGQSQQFTAAVSGLSNTAVTWAVVPAGQGSINSSLGYYTAPSSVAGSEPVTITATSVADSQKQASATVTVTNGGVANFLATDTGTEGAFQGIYGADYSTMVGSTGNAISNGSLSYGTFNVTGGQTYVWNASTTDPRALGGTASSWNNPAFNIHVTDGKLHQLALYALDWDMQGRAETIQIVDTATGATLDTRSISNFSNGVYLIWNVSGNITINVTVTSGPNPVISGVFFGGAVQSGMSVSPPSVDLSAGQSQQFSANVNGGNGNATWTITSVNPPGAASGTFSSTKPGLYTAPSSIVASTTVVISASASGLTGTATIILVPHATVSGPATFDTTTKGSWRGRYGAQGYSVAGDSQILPSFATFSVTGNTNGIQYWTNNASDPRALQMGGGSGTIAAAWSKNHESFSLNVDFTDTQVHQLAIYAVDWDYQGRTESIQILDAVTGKILDTEFLSNFSSGVYLIWHISGNVTINVTNDGNTVPADLSSGIVNGVFFQ